jgi:hypothetical protein
MADRLVRESRRPAKPVPPSGTLRLNRANCKRFGINAAPAPRVVLWPHETNTKEKPGTDAGASCLHSTRTKRTLTLDEKTTTPGINNRL